MKFLLLGLALGAAAFLIVNVVAQQRGPERSTRGPQPSLDLKAPTQLETATFALG